MCWDTAQRQHELTTRLTILQLRAEVLRRQVQHRESLSEADRRWLEQCLAAMLRTAQGLVPLLAAEWEPDGYAQVQGIPTKRLASFVRMRQGN
jgi:hypothetical protein